MISGKIWGQTQEIFKKNNVEIHRIEIQKDGFCSKHMHMHKFNAFFIESGKLSISVWKSYNLIDETFIGKKEMTVVAPNEYHMFRALEDTVAYEIYWVELDSNDIERENTGGVKGE